MLKINIMVDDTNDRIESNIDLDNASLADLSICERMLRRYVTQVSNVANGLLDKDTRREAKKLTLHSEAEEALSDN